MIDQNGPLSSYNSTDLLSVVRNAKDYLPLNVIAEKESEENVLCLASHTTTFWHVNVVICFFSYEFASIVMDYEIMPKLCIAMPSICSPFHDAIDLL